MKKLFTNDLKKGTKILLSNGWYGELLDNRKGNLRTARVEGIYSEIGDIYAHDIVRAYIGDEEFGIQLTPQQLSARSMNSSIFG